MRTHAPQRAIKLGRTVIVMVVLGIATPAAAQTMSFSVNNDTALAGDGLYLYGDVVDDSSGCSHGGYSTTAEIYSPSGRSASSQSSGLSASTFLALNGESGDYTVDTRGTYQCSCIFGGTAGYGNTQHVTPRTPGDLVSVPPDYWQYVDLGNYLLRRTWQVLDQSGAPYNYGNMTVNEAYSALTNGCNIVVSQGRGTTNSGGRFCDKYGNDTGISDPGCTTNPADSNPHNIQYCYSNPQCTSQFTQTISIVGFPFSHSVTYACTSVEISRP
jgi:hypothetical protein